MIFSKTLFIKSISMFFHLKQHILLHEVQTLYPFHRHIDAVIIIPPVINTLVI